MDIAIQNYIKFAKLTFLLRKCADECYCGDMWAVTYDWNAIVDAMNLLLVNISGSSPELAERIKDNCEKAFKEIHNRNMLTYIIEEKLLPDVELAMEGFEHNISGDNSYATVSGVTDFVGEEAGNDYFSVERSKSGMFVIRDNIVGKYSNSMKDPLWESYRQANYLFRPEINTFVILGADMGYLSYQLWEQSGKSIDIYIFEKNPKVVELGRAYGMYSFIPEERLHFCIVEDEGILFDRFVDLDVDHARSIFWVSDWIINQINRTDIKMYLTKFSENQKTVERFRRIKEINSNRNAVYYGNGLSELVRDTVIDESTDTASYPVADDDIYTANDMVADSKVVSEFIVVASGPSLNDNLEYIKAEIGKKSIVCVESALKKLIKEGIRPDYVVLIDPTVLVMRYIDDIEEDTSDSVLVAYDEAYWGYVHSFTGRKCIIKKNEVKDVWSVHTTVSSLAIETAIALGAEKIELVGLDLSYPGGRHYADDNGAETGNNIVTGIRVRSNDGGVVDTSPVFLQFISEIEGILEKYKRVSFINLSKNGAYIRGTYCNGWWEKEVARLDANNFLKRLDMEKYLSWSEKYYLMWQTVYSFLTNHHEISDCEAEPFWNSVSDTLELIKQDVVAKITIPTVTGNVNNKFIVLLTSNMNINDDDVVSAKVLQDAYKLYKTHRLDVLIVNTLEYLGGTKVTVENPGGVGSNTELENASSVFYMGERFPYFQFGKGMPDVAQIETFLQFMVKNTPTSFIAYDPFSIVADCCKKIGNVEYR